MEDSLRCTVCRLMRKKIRSRRSLSFFGCWMEDDFQKKKKFKKHFTVDKQCVRNYFNDFFVKIIFRKSFGQFCWFKSVSGVCIRFHFWWSPKMIWIRFWKKTIALLIFGWLEFARGSAATEKRWGELPEVHFFFELLKWAESDVKRLQTASTLSSIVSEF